MASDYTPENPNILFDLRQTYAMSILTPILLLIEEHRTKNEFPQWFDKLTMSLYINIYQKLTEGEREEYKTILQGTLNVINKYPEAYKGKDKTFEEVHKIKSALATLEMWMKDKMEETGMYGKTMSYDEGL